MKLLKHIGIALLVPILPCAIFVNHNEAYEVGIAWNFVSGNLSLQEGGFHFSSPWTLVARIDTRPQRVCITSGSHVAFNCKLVEFDTRAWREFVATEGWRYYWLSNRISFNGGYREEYRGMRDILRGYAFTSKPYPFIKILREHHGAPAP